MKEFPGLGMLDDFDYFTGPDADEDEKAEFFSIKDLAILKSIQSGDDIITVDIVGDTWTDDHETCMNVCVNGVKFAALWIVEEFYAEIIGASKHNADDKEALAKYIKEYLDDVDIEPVKFGGDLSEQEIVVTITRTRIVPVIGCKTVDEAIQAVTDMYLSGDGSAELEDATYNITSIKPFFEEV